MAGKHFAKSKKSVRFRKGIVLILSIAIIAAIIYLVTYFYNDWKSK